MEPNDISALFASDPEQGGKTESNIFDNTLLTSTNERNEPQTIKREDLTTKNAVKYLLEGRLKKKVCRYCLNVASPLSELDQVLQIGGSGVLYKITIRDMVASFHPFKVADDPNFPNKICNKCLNKTISSYLFTQQCERSERALRNCFEDMFHKLEKLDSIEPQKKRGRHKLHPNYNILYTEHEKVIDYAEPIINLINASSELLHDDEKNIFNDFECLKCWQVLPNLASLKNHETLHPKSMYYHCRHCGKSFTRKNLLKKHTLKAHDVPHDQKTDFRCLKCGVISDDYNTHLQHIEKHKFQMVLEHLVERNMDKLCAVCLDKNQPLTDLDKTVCLHGGYPKIMGDQSLYSILGSTVPDKSSYKYQELLVPIQAKVTRILKVKSSDIQNLIQEKPKYNFKLTSPTIIAIDETNFDDTHLYLFSSPCNIENDMGSKSALRATNSLITEGTAHISDNLGRNNKFTLVKEITTGLANEHIHISAEFANNSLLTTTDTDVEKNKSIDDDMKKIEAQKSDGNIFFSFSKPEYDCFTEKTSVNSEISAIATIASKVRKAEKPCNICWIFKKPICNKCLNVDNNKGIKNMDSNESGNTKSQCSYCWVFKNSDGCDNCMKQNELAKVDSGTKICEEPEKSEEFVPKKDSATIKRKLEDFTDDKGKRRKWECQICLTANTDREQCICCDAEGFLNKKLKLNLSYSNKDFFKHFNVINDERHLPLPLTPNLNKDLTEVNVTDHVPEKRISLNPEGTKIADVIEPSMMMFDVDDVDTMTQTKENEEMDIVQEDSSYFNSVKLVFNPYTTRNFPPIQDSEMRDSSTGNENLTSFKFHIGAVMPEDKQSGRKIKKPLRRSASFFHK